MLRACEDGDLETVKRLSSVITVREVCSYWYKESPLHIAARYVNLLFRTKIYTVLNGKHSFVSYTLQCHSVSMKVQYRPNNST